MKSPANAIVRAFAGLLLINFAPAYSLFQRGRNKSISRSYANLPEKMFIDIIGGYDKL